MRITILTLGSRGDTQPFIPLALGLKRAGHTVRVVGAKNFTTWVQGFGLDYFPLEADLAAMLNTSGGQAVMEAKNPLQSLLVQRRELSKTNVFDQMQQEVWQSCQGTEAIIYHPGMINGYYIARHMGVPCLMASPFPMTPTRRWPSALFYEGPRLGAAYNRLTYTVFEQAFWQMVRPQTKKFWVQKGMGDKVSFGAPYRRQREEQMPVLYAYSEHALPRPDDWPAFHHITGYWFLDAAPDWQPPAALTAFLQAGPPPVYVGFGSMGNTARTPELTEQVLKGLALTGQRGLLASGWNGLSRNAPLPDTVYMLEEAPHSWLFPQMAAVVHHGGAGTTGAGLRAGVPSIIVPHSVDQPMWGRRIAELGVGPQPIPDKRLTADKLAAAIRAALQPEMRAKAAHLGQQIRLEDGVAKAVEIVDHYLH